MTTASRSYATAPLEARLASGLLPSSYTTTGDVTPFRRVFPPSNAFKPRFRRRFTRVEMPSDDFRRTLHTLPLYTPGASEAADAPV